MLAFVLFCVALFAQQPKTGDSNTSLSSQFDDLARRSTSYGKYKSINMISYESIKQNVLDTLNAQKKSIIEKEISIENNNYTIEKLEKEVKKISTSLKEAKLKNDNRDFLGLQMSKNAFSLVLSLSFVALIALTAFFALQYQKNLTVTKKATNSYEVMLKEFEEYKKNSLRRFQEVNRKLQDELNKKWKRDKTK